MAAPISARRMVDLVGRKIEDTQHTRWLPAIKLEAIDQAVQHLLLEQARQRQDHDLDFVDLNVATELNSAGTMTDSGQQIREWRVPDYVYEIRLIEDTTESARPKTIPKYPIEQKEQYRSILPGAFWIWTKGGDIRTRVGFVGALTGVGTMRVWFIRRAAPLHYGSCPFGTVGGVQVANTNARMRFSTTANAVGRIINRGVTYTTPTPTVVTESSVYVGAVVEFGLIAGIRGDGVTDEIRKLISSTYIVVDDAPVPDTTDWVWAFDELLRLPSSGAGINCAGFDYSLVPQIGPEHHELVAIMAAVRLAEDAGGVRTLSILARKLAELQAAFINATENRQAQTPEFVQVQDDWMVM